MSRILVTGGAGFLGSNLCERLLDRGDLVYCMDNFSTGSSNNIGELYSNNRFHLILGNTSCGPIPEIDIDQIYHLASPTAPGAYQKDPEGTLEANIAGTENLLKMATEQRSTMLFTSSIRVTEALEIMSPHSCYVGGKRRGEELCLRYYEAGTRVKIARLYNTYGPKMATNDSRVVPQFVMRAIKGDPLKIVGTGLQKDSFCYVDDMLDGLMAYMDSDIFPGPVEFGYPYPISIVDLAELVIKVTHSKSPIIFNGIERSAREMEIKKNRPVPQVGEANAKLGWMPTMTLEDGLIRLADYYTGEMAK